MDRKRKSREEKKNGRQSEEQKRSSKRKYTTELASSPKSKEEMIVSSVSQNTRVSSQMLTNVELNLMQRANMPVEYIRASAMVTCHRLDEMKRNETVQGLTSTYSSRDTNILKKTVVIDRKESKRVGNFFDAPKPRRHPRRSELPTKPKRPANLWSVIRSCIGKDISNVTMPVGFSEPISMLQRLAEDFEYSYLLDKAVTFNDPIKQMAYISAFVVSAYASSGDRLTKPFNPLLGETYELDRRDDMGWRLMSEQVMQSPPTSAQFCESRRWKCWKNFSVSTMFRGKYLKVTPVGMSHLALDSGSIITWGRVESTVNNVLVGKMWLDNVGEIVVFDYTHESKCVLKFSSFDTMNKDNQRRVQGVVTDYNGHMCWLLNGKWDSHVEITPVRLLGDEVEIVAPPETIWRVNKTPAEISIFYNFNLFTCQLNEPEDFVAPTDSRKREDMRLMEEGLWDEADVLKKKLEQKDREENKNIDIKLKPIWFTQSHNPVTQLSIYNFSNSYWTAKAIGDWAKCPTIFTV